PPLQHHGPRRPRRPRRVVGRPLDPRSRRGPARRVPAPGRESPVSQVMTARAAAAAAALARLGVVDQGGGLTAAAIAPHLTGAHGAEVAAALGDLGTPEVAAVLVAVEPDVRDRAVHKEIRRALYRLRQRGVAIPAPSAPSVSPTTAATADTDGLVSGFDA